jgi:hypothetical protein
MRRVLGLGGRQALIHKEKRRVALLTPAPTRHLSFGAQHSAMRICTKAD